jgi:hypothetical protein
MKTFPAVSSLLPLALACLATFPVVAVDPPPSGTNTISGVVRFTNADADILARLGPPGNEGMTSFSIFAYTDPPEVLQSIKTIYNADPLSNPYALTVAVNDVPLTYNLYAYLALEANYEEYWTATRAATPLTSNSPPATVDLDECVALLELRYVDSAGQPVAAASARVLVVETVTGAWRARSLGQPPGRTENFLIVPSGVEIRIEVEVDTGTDIYLDRVTHRETHTATYACDDKPVITITIPDAGTLGRITGNANLVDEIELPTEGYQELLGRPVMKASGPSGNQRYAALAAESPGPDAARPFALEGLVPSTPAQSWNVWTELHFGAGHRFEAFRSPGLGEGMFNPGAAVTAGETTDLGDKFVMTPARLVGNITFTGPPEFAGSVSALRGVVRASDFDADMDGIPDGIGPTTMTGSYVVMSGVDELAEGATFTTAGASVTLSYAGAFNPATSSFEGDYEAVLGMLNDQPGVWKQDGIVLRLYDPGTNGGPLVDEVIYVTESAPWQQTLLPGERATNHLSYDLAEVCLRIRSPAPFFYPRVINSFGGLTNGVRSYTTLLQSASSPPYTADTATSEAVITFLVPEGSYTLNPAISIPDSDGGVSEVQLPPIEVTVAAGERYCVEECLRLVFTGPNCTTNFGFLTYVDAFACEATLTNLSLTTHSLDFPGIRLGYSDIRILEPIGGIPRATLRTAHGLFPEFGGYPREYYSNLVITAEARDTKGRIATRQIIAHYDLTPPLLNCSDITVNSENGVDAVVDFAIPTSSDGILVCVPPGGSTFPVGTTPVNCMARDLCRNTNTCAFTVTVRGPDENCALRIALTQVLPPEVTLAWDCAATLQGAETIEGPWASIDGATSPYPTPANGPHKFFRLCLSGDCSGESGAARDAARKSSSR